MWLINEFITGHWLLQVAAWLNQGSAPAPTPPLAGAPPGVVVAWWVAGTAWLEGKTGQVSPCWEQTLHTAALPGAQPPFPSPLGALVPVCDFGSDPPAQHPQGALSQQVQRWFGQK